MNQTKSIISLHSAIFSSKYSVYLKFKFNHPFIIKMVSTFQDDNKIYFVQEYCPGG